MSFIIPMNDKVLIEPAEKKEKVTASGIVLPDNGAKEPPSMGTIVALGEDVECGVEIGDTALFSKYGYDEVVVENTTYYVVSASQILAVIR